MSPIGKSKDEAYEFPVPNVVVSFCAVQGFGGVSYGLPFSPSILLEEGSSNSIRRGIRF